MRKRVSSIGSRTCLALLAILLAVPALAQPRTEFRISDSNSESVAIPADNVTALLHQGQQLEQQRRWGEALAHYENAIRQYPNEGSLQQRFDTARLHYDLERRYTDRSFCDAVTRLSAQRALDLYGQVLLKIDSHYVEAPRWQELLERGTSNFELALNEQTFIDRNVPQRNRLAIDAFRRELRALLDATTVNNRADAREAVAAAAALAQQRLEITPVAVVLEYLCGATNALDPYSTYLTPDQMNDVYAQIEGNFVGLGVELKAQDGGLAIVRVISGSPAEEAGIRGGDRIMAVNGRSTKDLTTDQAAAMLQGAEGTAVTLVVAAPGQAQRQMNVRRRRVEVPSVDQVRILDAQNGIGYFKLTCFQKTTARDLDSALWKLHHEGMKSLVVDVRGNPGGLLVSAVEVADRFVERGVIVSTHGRSPQEDFTYTAHDQAKWQMPLVVLIDQDSASAAEIFAGAIRDHHRGKIIGVPSFGKGTVQGIFPLEEYNAGVRLTTAKFYSPNGKPFNHIGVDPDIRVPVAKLQLTAHPVDGKLPGTGDATLNAAIEALTPTLQARSAM